MTVSLGDHQAGPGRSRARRWTFAEAILGGAPRRPQAFGGVFEAGGSDAFGAALEAVLGFGVPEGSGEHVYLRILAQWFPELVDGQPRACPACGMRSRHRDALVVIGVHLNDDHRWTREEFARWLAGERRQS